MLRRDGKKKEPFQENAAAPERAVFTSMIALLQPYLRIEQMCVNHGSFDIIQVGVMFKGSL